MKQFVDNAINRLKQTYEIPSEVEPAFRKCYEALFKLTIEQEENGTNLTTRQQIDEVNREMIELLHSCPVKVPGSI